MDNQRLLMRDENLCPICGSKMKSAKSQHGCYWRCTRWGCEGTRDVNGLSKQDKQDHKDDLEDSASDAPHHHGRWDR